MQTFVSQVQVFPEAANKVNVTTIINHQNKHSHAYTFLYTWVTSEKYRFPKWSANPSLFYFHNFTGVCNWHVINCTENNFLSSEVCLPMKPPPHATKTFPSHIPVSVCDQPFPLSPSPGSHPSFHLWICLRFRVLHTWQHTALCRSGLSDLA